jgi:hypothetical protein
VWKRSRLRNVVCGVLSVFGAASESSLWPEGGVVVGVEGVKP